jgi:hypothetical protein
MDDEDQFGIPSDYYSHYSEATPRQYSDNFPTSSFDEFLDEPLADKQPFEDFGEYMRVILIGSILYQANLCATIVSYDPSPDLFFSGPSEPGMGLYNSGAPGHHGLASTSSGLPPHSFLPEYGQYAARHDQSFQCMHSAVRRFLPTYLFL